jgi:hypothetical protein
MRVPKEDDVFCPVCKNTWAQLKPIRHMTDFGTTVIVDYMCECPDW